MEKINHSNLFIEKKKWKACPYQAYQAKAPSPTQMNVDSGTTMLEYL